MKWQRNSRTNALAWLRGIRSKRKRRQKRVLKIRFGDPVVSVGGMQMRLLEWKVPPMSADEFEIPPPASVTFTMNWNIDEEQTKRLAAFLEG